MLQDARSAGPRSGPLCAGLEGEDQALVPVGRFLSTR